MEPVTSERERKRLYGMSPDVLVALCLLGGIALGMLLGTAAGELWLDHSGYGSAAGVGTGSVLGVGWATWRIER